MDAKQAAFATKLLSAKTVVPMHWGTFPPLAQSTDEFQGFLTNMAPQASMVEMKPGEPKAFSRAPFPKIAAVSVRTVR